MSFGLINYSLPMLDPNRINGSQLFHFFWDLSFRLSWKWSGLNWIALEGTGHLSLLHLNLNTSVVLVNHRYLNVCGE